MKNFIIGLILSLFLIISANSSFGSPIISIDDANVAPGTTTVFLGLYILDVGTPVDSFTTDLALDTGLTLSGVVFGTLPEGWFSSANLGLNRLGATDFAFPANPIRSGSDLLFATLEIDIDGAQSVAGNDFTVGFDFVEIADLDGDSLNSEYTFNSGTITVIPIPSTILLLGGGLAALVAVRRRRS